MSSKLKLSDRSGSILMALAFLFTAIVLLISSFGGASHSGTIRHDIGSAAYPRILLLLIIFLAIVVMVQSLRKTAKNVSMSGWLRVISMIVVTCVYVAAIPAIGFVLSTIPFLILIPVMAGYRRPFIIGVVSIIYSIGVWLLFERVLYIILPSSPWFVF